jgi:hypothetical protein
MREFADNNAVDNIIVRNRQLKFIKVAPRRLLQLLHFPLGVCYVAVGNFHTHNRHKAIQLLD